MITAPIDLRELQHFVKQCDPMQPLGPEDLRYVELDAGTPVRGSDVASAIDEGQLKTQGGVTGCRIVRSLELAP